MHLPHSPQSPRGQGDHDKIHRFQQAPALHFLKHHGRHRGVKTKQPIRMEKTAEMTRTLGASHPYAVQQGKNQDDFNITWQHNTVILEMILMLISIWESGAGFK